MKRGFVKLLLDRFTGWIRPRKAPEPPVRRACSSRYHADRQRLRWGHAEELPHRSGKDPESGPVPAAKAGRPRPGFPGGRKLVFLVLPLLICVAAVAALIVTDRKETVPPPVEVKAAPADPLAGFPDRMKRELLAPEARVPATLKLTFTGKPEDLCRELAALGLDNNGWRRAPFARDRWQCASDLVALTTPSVDYGPTTLFFLLRGPDADTVDYLRLKLNVEDPKQMDIGQEAARLVIGALSDRYAWAVPEKVLDAIAEFEPLEITDRGVRLSVAPEDPDLTGDPAARQRLNIIIDFGTPDLIRPAREFERSPQNRRGL